MNKQLELVDFETAKLLKEKGFDWRVKWYFSLGKGRDALFSNRDLRNNNEMQTLTSAPTLALAQKWLREVHHLSITMFSSSLESWQFKANKPSVFSKQGNIEQLVVKGEDYYTYEQAQLAGIKEALKLI